MQKQFKGYIRNLNDGTVEVVAEIYDEDFDTFVQILREGSPFSSVEKIDHQIINDAEFHTDGFEIRY
jgi:acylphosphatase